MTYRITQTLVHVHTHTTGIGLNHLCIQLNYLCPHFKHVEGFHPNLPWCVQSLYLGICFSLCDTEGRKQAKAGPYQKHVRTMLLLPAATQKPNDCVYAGLNIQMIFGDQGSVN